MGDYLAVCALDNRHVRTFRPGRKRTCSNGSPVSLRSWSFWRSSWPRPSRAVTPSCSSTTGSG